MPRKSHLRRFAPCLVLILACLSGGCLKDGGGSDTETLTGLLHTADGKPAAGAQVKLVPSAYNPSLSAPSMIRSAFTDSKGRYRLPRMRKTGGGSYNLIAIADGIEEAAFVDSLWSDSVPAVLTLERSRVFFISLHGETYQTSDSGKAWFPGTDFFVRCEAAAGGKLDKVPKGISELVIESKAGWRQDYVVTNPQDSLVIRATRLEVQCQPY